MAESGQPGGAGARGGTSDAAEQARKAGREAQDRGADLAREAQGRASDVARQASERGSDVANEAQERLGQVAGKAQDRVADLVGKAREGAADVVSTARDELGPQKERAADALDTAAERGWDAAHKLRDLDQRWLSQIVGLGSQELSGIADKVRDNDLNGLIEELRVVARRQPAVFAGASVAAGFAMARMARFAMEEPAGLSGGASGRAAYSGDGTMRNESTSTAREMGTMNAEMGAMDTMSRAETGEPGQATQTTETPQTAGPGVPPARTYPGTSYDE